MMKYRIWDIRDGLLADDKTVKAKSPIEAVRKLYKNVKRVKNGGDIVVRYNRGFTALCYEGEPKTLKDFV